VLIVQQNASTNRYFIGAFWILETLQFGHIGVKKKWRTIHTQKSIKRWEFFCWNANRLYMLNNQRDDKTAW